MYAGAMSFSVRDDRRSPRSHVFLSAILEWPDRALDVVLRDLSEHGALVEFTGVIEADSEMLFRRNGMGVRGYIAWVRGKRAGVSFARPLKTHEVLRYIARPETRAVERSGFRRPAVSGKGMSAEEQRWANQMMNPSRRNGGK